MPHPLVPAASAPRRRSPRVRFALLFAVALIIPLAACGVTPDRLLQTQEKDPDAPPLGEAIDMVIETVHEYPEDVPPELREGLLERLGAARDLVAEGEFGSALDAIEPTWSALHQLDERFHPDARDALAEPLRAALLGFEPYIEPLRSKILRETPQLFDFSTGPSSCTVERDPSLPLLTYHVGPSLGGSAVAEVRIEFRRWLDGSAASSSGRLFRDPAPTTLVRLGLPDPATAHPEMNRTVYTLVVIGDNGWEARQELPFDYLVPFAFDADGYWIDRDAAGITLRVRPRRTENVFSARLVQVHEGFGYGYNLRPTVSGEWSVRLSRSQEREFTELNAAAAPMMLSANASTWTCGQNLYRPIVSLAP